MKIALTRLLVILDRMVYLVKARRIITRTTITLIKITTIMMINMSTTSSLKVVIKIKIFRKYY